MKYRNNFSIFLLTLFITTLIIGCGPKYSPLFYDSLAKIDISNATALALISRNDAVKSGKFGNRNVVKDATSENLLFKILPDGSLSEVQLLDKNGNAINFDGSFNPVYIQNINDNYILVGFGHGGMDDNPNNVFISNGYLVRKSDGAVFSLAKVGQPSTINFWGCMKPIQTDSLNNIYYAIDTYSANSKMVIMKINTQDVNNLFATQVSPAIDNQNLPYYSYNFLVDGEGNLLYGFSSQSGYVIRLVHASGQFEPVIDSLSNFWLGLDNKFYHEGWGEQGLCVYKINITGPNTGQYEQQEIPIDYGEAGYAEIPSGYNCSQVTVGNKIFRISNSSWGYGLGLFEIYNGTNVRRINLVTDIKTIYCSGASNECFYLCGTDSSHKYLFARVDVNGNVTQYTDPDLQGLEVYRMTVSGSGEILFSGYKYTGEKIIGKIDVGGNLVSEDVSLDTVVIQLEQIQ